MQFKESQAVECQTCLEAVSVDVSNNVSNNLSLSIPNSPGCSPQQVCKTAWAFHHFVLRAVCCIHFGSVGTMEEPGTAY